MNIASQPNVCGPSLEEYADPLRELPVRELWTLHAGQQKHLTASTLRSLRGRCELLAKLSGATRLNELDCFHLSFVRHYGDECGWSITEQSRCLSELSQMLLAARVEASEDDHELVERLDDCAGVAHAYASRVTSSRPLPPVAGAKLGAVDIRDILCQLASYETENLMPNLAASASWFVVVSLCCGAPAERLYEATVDDVRVEVSGLQLRLRDVRTYSEWPVESVAASMGFLSYVDRLVAAGHRHLFPALTKPAGRAMLARVLASRRMAEACRSPSGFSLDNLRATFEDSTCRSIAGSFEQGLPPVKAGLCLFDMACDARPRAV